MVDRLASDSSNRGTVSRFATEMHVDKVEPVRDEQLSYMMRNNL